MTHRPGATVIAALLLVATCACTSGSDGTSSPAPPATTPVRTVTATATPNPSTTTTTRTSSPKPSSSSSKANAGGTPPCRTEQLRLGPGKGNGAGGTAYDTYALTNTAATSCTLVGYPGVSVVDADRHIVQHAARRNATLGSGKDDPITVRPGAKAYFVVSAVDTDPDPACRGTRTGERLRVYPPNQTESILQSRQNGYQACELAVGRVFLR